MFALLTDTSGHAPENGDVKFGRSRFTLIIAAFVILLLSALVGGYFYWYSYRDTPQYSLALLISAARSDDEATVNSLVNVDTVVDDFVPQITQKAVEMYGRGLTERQILGLNKIARPILPAVKNRVREQLPRKIREKMERFQNVPFAAMVIGADRYLTITTTGDSAKVMSNLEGHSFEVQMKRDGDKWVVTGIRDEQLSTDIARTVGEEIIAIGSGTAVGERIGGRNITELLQAAEDILQ